MPVDVSVTASVSPLSASYYGDDGRWHGECDCGRTYSSVEAQPADHWVVAHVCLPV